MIRESHWVAGVTRLGTERLKMLSHEEKRVLSRVRILPYIVRMQVVVVPGCIVSNSGPAEAVDRSACAFR